MTDEQDPSHADARSHSNVGLGILSCDHKPTAVHIYGVYEVAGKPRDFPMNEVGLCDSCGSELWAHIKDSVSAQYSHYEIKPMPNVELRGCALLRSPA